MSANPPPTVTQDVQLRLKKLEETAELCIKLGRNIEDQVRALRRSMEGQVVSHGAEVVAPAASIPFDPQSTSPEAMRDMVERVSNMGVAAESVQAFESTLGLFSKKFLGKNSLYMEYLTGDMMTGAKGFLDNNGVLKQYDGDLSKLDFATLALWPEGFYRNAETKLGQFLIKTQDRKMLVTLDGLPSNVADVKIYLLDGTGETARYIVLRPKDLDKYAAHEADDVEGTVRSANLVVLITNLETQFQFYAEHCRVSPAA